MAVRQRFLSNNTCRGFLILRTESCSWLLHLPGNIELAGSKSRLAGEYHFRRCNKLNLTFAICRRIFESFTGTDRGSSKINLYKKMQIDKLLSVKELLFHIKK